MARARASRVGDIAVVAVNGAYLSSIGTLVDAFTLIANHVARMFAAPYEAPMESKVRLLATAGTSIVLSDRRVIEADGDLSWGGPLQLVYVAAFELNDEDALRRAIARETRLFSWLREQRDQGVVIGATAAATFLLAEAGLLSKGTAAPPNALLASFRRRHPGIHLDKRSSIIEHKRVFTASGLADEWALVTRLTEECLSAHTSRTLATEVGLLRGRQPRGVADDPLVAAAQFWLGERFAGQFRISHLARDLAVSQTTLLRRFDRSLAMTPRRYAQVLRIEAAKKMLVTTRRSVEQVSSMVGYADARSFREAFRKYVRASPTRYRERGARRTG